MRGWTRVQAVGEEEHDLVGCSANATPHCHRIISLSLFPSRTIPTQPVPLSPASLWPGWPLGNTIPSLKHSLSLPGLSQIFKI